MHGTFSVFASIGFHCFNSRLAFLNISMREFNSQALAIIMLGKVPVSNSSQYSSAIINLHID